MKKVTEYYKFHLKATLFDFASFPIEICKKIAKS